jgi:hypothetical protein
MPQILSSCSSPLAQISALVLPSSSTMNVNNAFYLSISLISTMMIFIALLLPESRIPIPHERNAASSQDRPQPSEATLVFLFRQLAHFVSLLLMPILVFRPRLIPGQPRRKTYNLTLLGLAIFIFFTSNVSISLFTSIAMMLRILLFLGRPKRQAFILPACLSLDN